MQANEAINVRMCADFHAHSTASDGTLTPRELVMRAAEVGVTHFALTDHDTIAGLEEAAAAAVEQGIQLSGPAFPAGGFAMGASALDCVPIAESRFS